jgi:hypothetical protein
MENSIDKLKRIKVDSLYGKKKHFNAGDRHEARHYWIGIPLIVINIITGSILFYVIKEGFEGWSKYIPLILTMIAALLSGFQTYLNLPRKVEGHRRVGNKYLSVMKKCDRIQGYIADNLLNSDQLVIKIDEIASEVEEVNREAESFPTTQSDYNKAKKGIETGEENYTEDELKL